MKYVQYTVTNTILYVQYYKLYVQYYKLYAPNNMMYVQDKLNLRVALVRLGPIGPAVPPGLYSRALNVTYRHYVWIMYTYMHIAQFNYMFI